MSNEMNSFRPAGFVPEVPVIPATRTPFNPRRLLEITGECEESSLYHDLILEIF